MNALKRIFAADFDRDVRESVASDQLAPADAEAHFDDLAGRFAKLDAEAEDIRLALSIQIAGGHHPDLAPAVLARADAFHELVRKPERARARLEVLDEEREKLEPQLRLARDRRQVAREERAMALAAEFKPRHRATVRAIGEALEALSKAVADEQAIHVELQQQLPGFVVLPDFGGLWRHALLNSPRSDGSNWVRAAQAAGYIDE